MNKQLQNVVNDDDRLLIQVELLKLLEQQTKKYTSGDSSSIPVELGQELLDSLLFCIGVGLQGRDYMGQIEWSLLLHGDFASVIEKGRGVIKNCIEYGKELWKRICISLPSVENRSMKDTLKSIGTFWEKYDSYFFAHEIPCDIDYQLSIPVSEKKKGVLYVIAYLEQLAMENHFLSYFDRNVMISVLERYCPDYEGLLINLYEPIATNAIGCTLLERDFETLTLTPEEQKDIGCIFEHLSGKSIESKMDEAAQLTLEKIGCQIQGEKQLLTQYAKNLAVRIEKVRDVGGISGVFL